MELDIAEVAKCIEADNEHLIQNVNMNDMNDKIQVLTTIIAVTNDENPYFKCNVDQIPDQNMYVVSLNNMKIPFYKLSDLYRKKVNGITKMIDTMSGSTEKLWDHVDGLEDEISNLHKESNRNACHELSLNFSKQHGGDIVTARLEDSFPGYVELHSWVEKDDYCIDYTNNLVMMKDFYYLFVDEVLNIITENDAKDLPEEINGICSVLYMGILNSAKVK